MDFVVLDFEMAAPEKFNPCEIGLTFVKNSQIVATKSWLIKPPCYPNFYQHFAAASGITPMDVAQSPEFPDVWREVLPMIEGELVLAHFASFDMDVLCQTLTHYGLDFPNITYACTHLFAKIVFPVRVSNEANEHKPYGLAALCKTHKIKFRHHRAGEDARAAAELALIMFAKRGILSIEDISSNLNVRLGRITADGCQYPPYKQGKSKQKTKKPVQKKATVRKAQTGVYRCENHFAEEEQTGKQRQKAGRKRQVQKQKARRTRRKIWKEQKEAAAIWIFILTMAGVIWVIWFLVYIIQSICKF